MTRVIILIILCINVCIAYSQKSNIEVLFGYQKHDKRFSSTAAGVDGLAGVWGTRYSGIMYKRQIYKSGNFEFIAGIGYARETNTFPTPYNHCFDNLGEPCSEVLLWIDKYSIDMLPFSFGSEYHFNQRFTFRDRKSTRLNSSHSQTSYAVFC